MYYPFGTVTSCLPALWHWGTVPVRGRLRLHLPIPCLQNPKTLNPKTLLSPKPQTLCVMLLGALRQRQSLGSDRRMLGTLAAEAVKGASPEGCKLDPCLDSGPACRLMASVWASVSSSSSSSRGIIFLTVVTRNSNLNRVRGCLCLLLHCHLHHQCHIRHDWFRGRSAEICIVSSSTIMASPSSSNSV